MPVTLRVPIFAAEPPEEVRTAPELFSQEQLEAHAERLAADAAHGAGPGARTPACAAPRQERRGPRGRVSHAQLGEPRRTQAGRLGRLAPRQLSRRPGSDPRDPTGSAAAATTSSCPSWPDGPFEGYPRVYVLARELVMHTAGRFDLQTLIDFVVAYQRGAAALDRRNLGDPDHAAARAGRGAARSSRATSSRRAAAASLRAGGVWSSRIRRPSAEKVIGRALREASRHDRAPAGSRSSSSCCSGCAISRRRPRPRGRRCSGRSRRRTTRPTRCCGASTSARRPTSSAIGNVITQHAAAVVDRLAAVLRARQPGRADPAQTIRRGRTARWTFRRAIAIGTRSRSWPRAPSGRSWTSRGARSRSPRKRVRSRADARPPPSRRLLPDLARPLRSSKQDLGYPPTIRERVARFMFRHPVLGLPGHDRGHDRGSRSPACCRTRDRSGATSVELWLVAARRRCCRSASWPSAC